MSASSNDADDLSLSCSVSTVKSEESEVSEVEGGTSSGEMFKSFCVTVKEKLH